MRNKYLIFVIILISSLSSFFYGCATILKGENETVDINSDPKGAKIIINGRMLGKTPLQIKLKPKNTSYIEFEKAGYEKKTFILSSSVGGGWVILDIIFGLVPLAIDAATGSWYNFDDNYANVYLEKENNTDIDQKNNSRTNLSQSQYDEFPSFFPIKLKSDEADTLFNGKVSFIYKSAGWGKSLLSTKWMGGFSENLDGIYKNKSIRISKGDIIYFELDKNVIYRIEVIQEILSTITLEFTKL
jgi:hypothetical protein